MHRLKHALAATVLATSGLGVATVLAATPAQASAVHYNTYGSLRACQLDQRSLGHQSSIRIVSPCTEYDYGCTPGQCQVEWNLAWAYR
jgi:hypothetical protein